MDHWLVQVADTMVIDCIFSCSSRSHAIFVITIECSEDGLDGKNHIRVGKLNLVDLAGSERQVCMTKIFFL